MFYINNFFLHKSFYYFFCIILTFLSLGLFNSSWSALFMWSGLFFLFYSSTLNLKYKNWKLAFIVTLLGLLVRSYLYIPSINVGSNVFIGGEDYSNSIFSKELPSLVFKRLNNDFIINFPNSIAAPDKNLFEKSVTQMVYKSSETKKITEIKWKNRYELALSSFNNTKYNAYGQQQPNRKNLPYFIKYTIPKEYNNNQSKFCWKGYAYFQELKLEEMFNSKKNCVILSNFYHTKKEQVEIWLVDPGDNNLEAELIAPINITLKIFLIKVIKVFNTLVIFILLFKSFNMSRGLQYLGTFLITFLFAVYFNPTILHKFILFEGGNDGLLYVHFAHLISENISQGNYLAALQGGENAFDLMPFYRYVWVLNYLLFEESPWMFFFILNALPLVVFYILKYLLNIKWATVFMFFWFLFPFFEAFGFFHFYYVKLTLRGFAEPLSYLAFLSALAILINVYYKNKKPRNFSTLLCVGFLFSLTIGLRANILPACFVMILYIFYEEVNNRRYKYLISLAIGLSLTFTIPIHNYYFSDTFVPLTIAAYKDWNLGASPSDYLNLLISILRLNVDTVLGKKIVSHINGEIKLYEIWYFVSIFSCIYCTFRKKIPTIIRFISISGLSLISMLFFYHVGGRYSYLSWTLTLIIFLYCMKEFLFPLIKEAKTKYVS